MSPIGAAYSVDVAPLELGFSDPGVFHKDSASTMLEKPT